MGQKIPTYSRRNRRAKKNPWTTQTVFSYSYPFYTLLSPRKLRFGIPGEESAVLTHTFVFKTFVWLSFRNCRKATKFHIKNLPLSCCFCVFRLLSGPNASVMSSNLINQNWLFDRVEDVSVPWRRRAAGQSELQLRNDLISESFFNSRLSDPIHYSVGTS